MGLQRSISHRQMSLGSKPSSESLHTGGGSGTHELPRLPGATSRSRTSPRCASTVQLLVVSELQPVRTNEADALCCSSCRWLLWASSIPLLRRASAVSQQVSASRDGSQARQTVGVTLSA